MKALVFAYGTMIAVVISRTVDTVGEAVVFLGAVAVAFEALRRVVGKPLHRLYCKADHAFDQMASFPSWRQGVNDELERHGRQLETIERKIGESLDADVTVREIHEIRGPHAT